MAPTLQVLFDLDNTLIDTEKIKSVFRKIARQYKIRGVQIDEQKAEEIYVEARTNEDGKKIAITLDNFLEVLENHIDGDVDRDGAHRMFEEECAKEVKFDGVEKLLKELQERGVHIFVLTLGVREWQDKKLEASGLNAYFSEEKKNVLYTEDIEAGKIEMIRQKFGRDFTGEGFVLFNDKPDECEKLLKAFEGLKICVHNEHVDKKYSQDEFDDLKARYGDKALYQRTFNEASTEFTRTYLSENYERDKR